MNYDWVLARLREPSTWAGLATMLGSAAVFGLSVETWTQVVAAATAVAGAVAAIKADRA